MGGIIIIFLQLFTFRGNNSLPPPPPDSSYDKGAHLNYEDVAVDCLHCPRVLKVTIKASKTDPFRVGMDIFVGKTGNQLYPATAILSYMVARRPGDGPFFRFDDGKPLTRPRFVMRIKEALTTAGLDCPPYSGHSFRRGAVTTAAALGFNNVTIKIWGVERVMPTSFILKRPEINWLPIPTGWEVHCSPPPNSSQY